MHNYWSVLHLFLPTLFQPPSQTLIFCMGHMPKAVCAVQICRNSRAFAGVSPVIQGNEQPVFERRIACKLRCVAFALQREGMFYTRSSLASSVVRHPHHGMFHQQLSLVKRHESSPLRGGTWFVLVDTG